MLVKAQQEPGHQSSHQCKQAEGQDGRVRWQRSTEDAEEDQDRDGPQMHGRQRDNGMVMHTPKIPNVSKYSVQ